MKKIIILSIVALFAFASTSMAMDDSLRAGIVSSTVNSTSSTELEVSFPCLLAPKMARTFITLGSANSVTSIGISPQYIFDDVAKDLELGAGVVLAIASGNSNTTTNVGVVGSADYAFDQIHVGIQLNIVDGNNGTAFKVGYAF